MNFDMTVISNALQVLLEAVLPVLVAFVVAWVKAKIDNERMKLSENQTYALDMFVKVAVYAAEQMGATDKLENKFEYAQDLVEKYCISKGLTISTDDIRARIEAEVGKLNSEPLG